jgi:hypothetical protein
MGDFLTISIVNVSRTCDPLGSFAGLIVQACLMSIKIMWTVDIDARRNSSQSGLTAAIRSVAAVMPNELAPTNLNGPSGLLMEPTTLQCNLSKAVLHTACGIISPKTVAQWTTRDFAGVALPTV